MSLTSEHKALVFVGAIAVLGAGVRVLRAASGPDAHAESTQTALERQVRSADSSARAAKGRGGSAKAGGRGRARGNSSRAQNTPGMSGTPNTQNTSIDPPTSRAPFGARAPLAPLDRTGYIANRLDLDVATAAQIDSLPGMLPRMAKRIVADRAMRGPFLNMNGLRRVSGVGPKLIDRIDSLVTFSGTVVQPNPADTIIPKAKRSRAKSTST